MAIAARLRQTLVIERATAGALDAWNHAPLTWADLATVKGRVEDRAGREIAGPQLGETVITDALVFLPIGTDVTARDRIRTVSGRRYELLGDALDAGARGRHLQADARRIAP